MARLDSPKSRLGFINHWNVPPNPNISAPRLPPIPLHLEHYKNVCHITSWTSWSGKILSSDLPVVSTPSFLSNLKKSQVLSLHIAFLGNFGPQWFLPDLNLKSQPLFWPSVILPFKLSPTLGLVFLSSLGIRTTAYAFFFFFFPLVS